MIPVCVSSSIHSMLLMYASDPNDCLAGWLALANNSCYRLNYLFPFTLRHIYSHGGNVGNKCADHAAALGTLGFCVQSQCQCTMAASSVRHCQPCEGIAMTLLTLNFHCAHVASTHHHRIVPRVDALVHTLFLCGLPCRSLRSRLTRQ